jgi:hypothetical protein
MEGLRDHGPARGKGEKSFCGAPQVSGAVVYGARLSTGEAPGLKSPAAIRDLPSVLRVSSRVSRFGSSSEQPKNIWFWAGQPVTNWHRRIKHLQRTAKQGLGQAVHCKLQVCGGPRDTQ